MQQKPQTRLELGIFWLCGMCCGMGSLKLCIYPYFGEIMNVWKMSKRIMLLGYLRQCVLLKGKTTYD